MHIEIQRRKTMRGQGVAEKILLVALASLAVSALPAWEPSFLLKENVLNDDYLRIRLRSPSLGPEDPVPAFEEANVQAMCLGCELAVAFLKEEFDLGVSNETLIAEGKLFCATALGYTKNFCNGYVELLAPIFYYIFTHDPIYPADFCGMVMSSNGCNTTRPERDWSVEIHDGKPPVIPIILPDPTEPTIKVLQISDTHMDPLYAPGSNAQCGEQLCCRSEWGEPPTPDAEAWFWGDYRYCGSPPWMLEDMLAHIRSEHQDLSYVMWTGDVVPHNMWSTSKEWNMRLVKETNEMIQAYFQDIPVFPVIGNHEMSPIDQYPDPDNVPAELAADWLYESLAAQWARVIPDLDISTVLYAGFYSVPITPGFRIISVNSMFGYGADVWLYQNSNDVAHELAWLENELWKAEQEGELVHLLGHIPPGLLSNERTWSREYNRIIRRYENIIRGQFFGHTHYDEFEVFHDGDRPIGVAYVAPSQTPWYYLNPAYRIYTIDGERPETTRMVLDHSTYVMNLTEAHETNVTRWFELYSAKDAYGMQSLKPEDWHQLGLRMADDRTLFDVYWRNFVSIGEPYLAIGCDDLCYEQRLCDVMTSDRNDLDACYGAIQRKKNFDKISRN
ncbi:sphingomyelin phosphodiesterase-like isoform X1 [Macrobrachium nipponense]|uniref:sphingomyelin phosphodiesterase-like isoform X1 n=2 Tax=Macrobrachium nipponense TaxID=159736 RepID=UPI0030C7AA8C